MKKEEKLTPKPKKQNKVSFKCPVTGLLCTIEDPTLKQLDLIAQHKLTAMALMR